VANALDYFDTAIITAIKSFIVPTPGWKGLPGTNSLAFYENLSIKSLKSFIKLISGLGGPINLTYSLTYGDAPAFTGVSTINVVNTKKDPVCIV
jgi:hypothetical protein